MAGYPQTSRGATAETRPAPVVCRLNVKRLALGFPGTGTLDQWIASLRQLDALEALLAGDALTEHGALPNYVPQRDRNIEDAFELLVSAPDGAQFPARRLRRIVSTPSGA